MTAALLFLCMVHAPAPRVKPPPSLGLFAGGATVMTWRGKDAETYFHADGTYACLWCGAWWGGRWTQKEGVVSVVEWPQSNPGLLVRWSVKLKDAVSGDLDGSPGWKVRPLPHGRID